ncbi:MAG TPA: helix-turn-helix domain-containing protein [Steroidobacteraceae bacterium]|nr:helix-turn-helix domain-containing protein [Steroidobacteraceae bacterium]
MRLAAKSGMSLPNILRGLDLPANILDGSRAASISLADYFRILERLAISARDETWGLSARPLLPGATGLVLSNLSSCATLLEAMKAVAHAYNLLHGGAYNRVELRKDRLAYIIDDRGFPYAPRMDASQTRFAMVSVLIFLHALLVLISDDGLHRRLRKVHIKGARLAGARGYLEFWAAPIRWKSSTYALDYDLAAGSAPVACGGPVPSSQAIYRKIIDLIEHNQSVCVRHRSVRERVVDAFEDNVFTQRAVAKRLGLGVATLRRRLEMEGSPTFRVLNERAVERAARSLLEQRHHPSDVAEELGFSDLRSFARAFKRWTGVTPTVYAKRSRYERVRHKAPTPQHTSKVSRIST